jgi:alpha-L-fucosidase
MARIFCSGFDAKAQGTGFSYGDGKAGRYYVDGLEKKGNSLEWKVRVDQPARFSVDVRYSTPRPTLASGAKFVVRVGSSVLSAPVTATASEREMGKLHLGELDLAAGDLQQIEVSLEGAVTPVHFFEVDLTTGAVARR